MQPAPFGKIAKELSLSEKIEQQIIEAIRKKIFVAGDKLLGEMELAENFGVSRTAVREALHRLAGRGIVEIRKNTGVFVMEDQYSPVTDSLFHLLEMKSGNSSLINIASVRLILEPEIASLAASNHTQNDVMDMRAALLQMEKHCDDRSTMIEYDITFHRLLAKATKNPILPVIMEPLFQLMKQFMSDTYEFPQSPFLALKSHMQVLSAIEKRDARLAAKAMKTHMKEAMEHAVSISTE